MTPVMKITVFRDSMTCSLVDTGWRVGRWFCFHFLPWRRKRHISSKYLWINIQLRGNPSQKTIIFWSEMLQVMRINKITKKCRKSCIELHTLYLSTNIILQIKRTNIRRTGHVSYMRKISDSFKISVRKYQRIWLLRRHTVNEGLLIQKLIS